MCRSLPMERTTTSPATAASALAAKYDFNSQRRVLDLGGGTGSFLLASLNRFEQLQATLHDLPPRHGCHPSPPGRNPV